MLKGRQVSRRQGVGHAVELWISQTADFKEMGDSSKAAKKESAKE